MNRVAYEHSLHTGAPILLLLNKARISHFGIHEDNLISFFVKKEKSFEKRGYFLWFWETMMFL